MPQKLNFELDYSGIELADLLDSVEPQSLLDDFYALTGFGIGIIDLKGNILVAEGWQDICLKFHRVNQSTLNNCMESDNYLTRSVPRGEFRAYHCKNNLWDISTPIIIEDKHLGNIFLGQFFYDDEEIDYDFFRKQAKLYGFAEDEYILALEKVPRWSRNKVFTVMRFYSKLAVLISKTTVNSYKLSQANIKKGQLLKSLMESETKFRELVKVMPDSVVVHQGGKIVYVNDAALKTMEVDSYDRAIGEAVLDYVHPDYRKIALERIKSSFKTNMTAPLEEEVFITYKGRRIDVEVTTLPIVFDENPSMLVIFRDISERKKQERMIIESEKKLQESEQKWRAIVAKSPDGIAVTSLDGVIEEVSAKAVKIFGYESAAEITGKTNLFDFIAPSYHAKAALLVKEMLRGNYTGIGEYIGVKKSGENFYIECNADVLQNTFNEPANIIFVIRDITERKRIEDKILKLNTELEQRVDERTLELSLINKELESFAYSVSHDLRAPLRGIDCWSTALFEEYGGMLDETAKNYLDRMHHGVIRMNRLIDDLLDLSRLSRAEFTTEKVNLSQLAATITARLSEENSRRKIIFKIEPGLFCSGDIHLLEIMLFNLLNNACKFTSNRDTALIEIGRIFSADENLFYIRDNGAGFDMQYSNKLFGVFQRLHKASEFPGNGIGLATVQRIINRHGGRIWAEAELSKGATFYFVLK